MLPKKSTLLLVALVLVASMAGAQTPEPVVPPVESTAPAPAPSPPAPSPPAPSPPTTSVIIPTSAAPSLPVPTQPNTPAPSVPTSQSTTPSQNPGAQKPKPTTHSTGGTPPSQSTSSTSAASPSPTKKEKESGASGKSLATAGIVVGAVVVAAAIGIWVFRKWKLSPSRDFQSKIRGDDYQDYPRSYESDTVFLRNLGDQPAEPAPSKSPYTAGASLPVDDQYYDTNYSNDHQNGAYNQRDGYGAAGAGGAVGAGGAGGYDQTGYDHQAGYDQHQAGYEHGYDNGYHNEYAASQVSGGGGYAAPQAGGYSQAGGGYAQSNVGGGYQHQGYEDYGRR